MKNTLKSLIKTLHCVIKLPRRKQPGRPPKYKTKTMVKFFALMVLKKIIHFKAMINFLMNNPHTAKDCGFTGDLPQRTTLSRRFKKLYNVIKAQVRHMGALLTTLHISTSRICSADSTLHPAYGNVWHMKHKRANFIPEHYRNIDRDAGWGRSEYRDWVYGYKTHLISTSSFQKPAIPLYCHITSANESDCPTTKNMLNEFWPAQLKYLLGDKAFDETVLRELCDDAHTILLTPLKKTETYKPRRKESLRFYQSKLGRKIYALRSISIEPLFGHLKELFDTGKLKVKGLSNVQTLLSLCVWLYQVLIFYNYILGKPLKNIKWVLCSI